MREASTPREMGNPHISHQTGAELLILSFQTMELMKNVRQARPVQAILRHIPVFQAETEGA